MGEGTLRGRATSTPCLDFSTTCVTGCNYPSFMRGDAATFLNRIAGSEDKRRSWSPRPF
jgi:hypothetical protein